jgi:hypothetical protein
VRAFAEALFRCYCPSLFGLFRAFPLRRKKGFGHNEIRKKGTHLIGLVEGWGMLYRRSLKKYPALKFCWVPSGKRALKKAARWNFRKRVPRQDSRKGTPAQKMPV